MDPGLHSRHLMHLVSDIRHATPVTQNGGSCQASPAGGYPASTTPSPGSLYRAPSMDSRPTSATSLPGGSYQDLTMYCRPTSIPIRSGNSNSDLTTGSYGILASRYKAYAEIVSTLQKMCETPHTEVFVAYVVEVPHYAPGPAVLFLSQAPKEHIIYYDVLQNAAVPPWPPPALSRLAHAPIQPWPPQVPRSPLSPYDSGILSSTQPLSQVYSTLCLKASRGEGDK